MQIYKENESTVGKILDLIACLIIFTYLIITTIILTKMLRKPFPTMILWWEKLLFSQYNLNHLTLFHNCLLVLDYNKNKTTKTHPFVSSWPLLYTSHSHKNHDDSSNYWTMASGGLKDHTSCLDNNTPQLKSYE